MEGARRALAKQLYTYNLGLPPVGYNTTTLIASVPKSGVLRVWKASHFMSVQIRVNGVTQGTVGSTAAGSETNATGVNVVVGDLVQIYHHYDDREIYSNIYQYSYNGNV